jgi:hypothetical protein
MSMTGAARFDAVTGADVTGAAMSSDDDDDDESLHSPDSGEVERRRVGDGLVERLPPEMKRSAARRADRRVGEVDADDEALDGSIQIGDVDAGGAADERPAG